jgi:large subunit ribosomal protein L22
MKAHLRSVRIAPKKANIIAKMVRGMPVHGAMDALHRTHKKGARMVEQLLRSAMANASHNDGQTASQLVIKSIVVNQGTGYRRGVPMSRGRVRPMTKFLSHISLTLGVADEATETSASTKEKPAKTPVKKATKKTTTASSQTAKNTVKSTPAQRTPSSDSSPTSDASAQEDPSSAS